MRFKSYISFIEFYLTRTYEFSRKYPLTVYYFPILALIFLTWTNFLYPSFQDTLALQYAALVILTAWYSGLLLSFVTIAASIFSASIFFQLNSTLHFGISFALVFFPIALVISSLVMSQRHAYEAANRLALHDSLTQLPNRLLLHEQLELIYEMGSRNNYGFGVVFIDVDNFKGINDQFGHLFGDMVLKHVAQHLRRSARGEDVVARYGGDEFIIILNKLNSSEEAIQVLERISAALEPDFQHNGSKTSISVSMGLAIYPQHACDTVQLLKRADAALYEAKKRSGNSFVITQ